MREQRRWPFDFERADEGMSTVGIVVLVSLGAIGVLCLVALFLFIWIFSETPFLEGVESRTVEGVLEPGQTMVAHVDVTVDMGEVAVLFDELTIDLTLADPSSDAAVFGSFDVGTAGETRPALIRDTVDVATMEVPYPCRSEVKECRIPIVIRLGNVGGTVERWMMTASISRSTRDAGEASSFEVPSLNAVLTGTDIGDEEWISPGPVVFDVSDGVVAYAINVETSIADPSLFEVVVTEPRQFRLPRRIAAVIGPEDSLVHNEAFSARPFAEQADCTDSGCQLHLVSVFWPRDGEWWIPIVRPAPQAPRDLFKDHTVHITIDEAPVTATSGSLGRQKPAGTLTLHIESEPHVTKAVIAVDVSLEGNSNRPSLHLRTDDGQIPDMYDWFELSCTASRCVREITTSWRLVGQQDASQLNYWAVVIGGIGDGRVSSTPSSIELINSPSP